MDNEELAVLARVEDTHWWYRTRQVELLRWAEKLPAGAKILDVGSAAGGHVRALLREGFDVQSLELSDWAVAYQRSLGIPVTQGDARSIPWPDASFDAVICLDVLEHIVEDRDVVIELRRILKPNGRFLVAVPEDQTLWSEHDVAVGHERRYARAELLALLDGAALQADTVWSSNVLLKPLVRLRRRHAAGSELAEASWLQNVVCTAATRIERMLGFGRFAGMTVWAAGRATDR